jgi:sucrose-6-phosphate hydrolase SacC (GH32 family)
VSIFDGAASLILARPASIYIPLGGAASWRQEQVFDFQVFVDPADSTRVLCYCSGMASPTGSNNIVIGRFHAPALGLMHSWTDDGPLISPTAATWDATFCRMGSLFYDSGTFYCFYTGSNDSNATESIGLATSTDGVTFTKYAGNPILTPTGQGRNDGDHVSEPAVLKEGSSWTMVYGYRNGGTTLPGYRYATSTDGHTWTKGGSGDILTNTPLFSEFHQLVKFGTNDYALVYEAGNATVPYRIFVARATSVTGPYTNWASNPLLAEQGGSAWDKFHVATPFMTQINGRDLLFYCGASDVSEPYASNTWPGSFATLYSRLPRRLMRRRMQALVH